MKRVIKFRAYTEISNEVLGMKYDVPHTHNDTVMQFTGLLDRNGKEIYEGDVVIVPNFNYEPDNGQNPKYLLPIGYQPTGFTVGKDWMSELSSDDYEIIGNIYEHSHLLTQHNNHDK